MSLVSLIYKKQLLCRYDKTDIAIPYYDVSDFPSLKKEQFSFINSRGTEIAYFFYYYDNYRTDKIIIFCHGIGAGHTAYLKEIEAFAKAGFRVLTLDYAGCDKSKGERMESMNSPSRDVYDLINYVHPKEEIVLVGHSLGGYTALNVNNLRREITKSVIISGFISLEDEVRYLVKKKHFVNQIMRYEQKIEKEYFGIDNLEYIKTTEDELLFIQSTDDGMVPYETNLKVIEGIDNPHIHVIKEHNKRHNPTYTVEAVNFMTETFKEYNKRFKHKKASNLMKRSLFLSNTIDKMTDIDKELFKKIIDFIN